MGEYTLQDVVCALATALRSKKRSEIAVTQETEKDIVLNVVRGAAVHRAFTSMAGTREGVHVDLSIGCAYCLLLSSSLRR